MMIRTETETVQNTLRRLIDQVYLNIDDPTKREKSQYSRAVIALEKARHEFDLLNDLKACRITKGE